jgi:adenylate cyclase
MFTDIVGYTSLMGKSERQTLEILDKNRAIHKPIIERYNGTFIKELGDGIMASFNTASEAVHAAISIQEECKALNTFQLRIGLHLGEIVFEDGDVFGDGVNIAARIQGAAEPNTIYMSESVHQNVSNKEGIETVFVGSHNLKHVSSTVRLYQVRKEPQKKISEPSYNRVKNGHALQSIAVLPFTNMSNDPGQEYFCDGISEEIIDTLAPLDNLRVIARTSTFSFKGKNLDVREIGKTLGANALLEGSVRKSGDQLRITTKLLSVSNGSYLWTNRYDRKLEDVFAIQEDIATSVATELKGYLSKGEKEQIQPQKTELAAYEFYLKGRQLYSQTDMPNAKIMFEKALSIDPKYSPACAALANTHCFLYDWWGAHQSDLEAAEELSSRALSLSPNMAICHVSYGFTQAHLGNFTEAEIAFKEAIRINPKSFDAYYSYARILFSKGQFEQAAEMFQQAANARLEDFQSLALLSQVLRDLGSDKADQALTDAGTRIDRQLDLNPSDMRALSLGSSVFFHMGQEEKAFKMIEKAIGLYPEELTVLFNGACMFANAGEKDKAFDLLEMAIEKGFGHKDWIENDSDYDSLRNEPRYIELMKRI